MLNFEIKMKVIRENLNKYLKASKKEKGKILDELADILNLSREQIIRNFRKAQLHDSASFKEGRGRKEIYNAEVNALLKKIWELSYRTSGELLEPVKEELLNSLKKDDKYNYSKEAEELVLKMSLGTIKNRIKYFKDKEGKKKKGLSGTTPSQLKKLIPVYHGDWKDKGVGYGQLDTVWCGWSIAGDFFWALNYVDITVYWSVFRFQWNKGQIATLNNFKELEKQIPWKIKGIHPDSGGEFINWNLKEYCDDNDIEMTRSRPNKKNDNNGVEERNGHVIRKFIGYRRLECKEHLVLWNALAFKINLFVNHFKAVRRTIEKVKVNNRYVRKFDKAKTPFQRVFEEKSISQDIKDKLIKEHLSLDPLTLKREIDKMIITLINEDKKCNQKKS